jgi:hypothetical protein
MLTCAIYICSANKHSMRICGRIVEKCTHIKVQTVFAVLEKDRASVQLVLGRLASPAGRAHHEWRAQKYDAEQWTVQRDVVVVLFLWNSHQLLFIPNSSSLICFFDLPNPRRPPSHNPMPHSSIHRSPTSLPLRLEGQNGAIRFDSQNGVTN